MNCEEVLRLVDASIDGELDRERNVALDAHVRSCASCSALVESRRVMRAAIRSEDLYFRAPSALQQRIRQELTDAEHRIPDTRTLPTAPSRPSLGWLAAAAMFILVAAAGAWLLRSRPVPSDALAQEVIAVHIRSLLPGHLTDVPSTDQHTVKPWFAGRVDFSPPVTDFTAEGYVLVGGRVDYLDGRTVAALVYKRREHVINVFVWPAASEVAMKDESARGYHVMSWSTRGLRYAVVSDLNTTELRRFADLLRR